MDRQTKQYVDAIHGWLRDDEARCLYRIASACTGKGVIVEIGSWKGKSTVCLGRGTQQGQSVSIFAIDPHTGGPEQHRTYGKTVDTFDEFQRNIEQAGISNLVIPIVKTSEDAAKAWDGRPIEFLWIDGVHEYDYVIKDYTLWEPYLMEGGLIAFHDSMQPGPRKVIFEHIFANDHFVDLQFAGWVTVARKVAHPTTAQKRRKRWAIFYRMTRHKLWLIAKQLKLIRRS